VSVCFAAWRVVRWLDSVALALLNRGLSHHRRVAWRALAGIRFSACRNNYTPATSRMASVGKLPLLSSGII